MGNLHKGKVGRRRYYLGGGGGGNLPSTSNKLHCKGEPYRLSSYRDPSLQTKKLYITGLNGTYLVAIIEFYVEIMLP